jgi:hypothetical protein
MLHFWLIITKGRTTMTWDPKRHALSSNSGTLPERTSIEATLAHIPNIEHIMSTYASKT